MSVMRYKPDWLNMVCEEALDPALPIIGAHHHLYDDQVRNATMGRFLLDEFLREIDDSWPPDRLHRLRGGL